MEQAKQDLSTTAKSLYDQAIQEVNAAKAEIQNINVQNAGVSIVVALILSISLHLATKAKEDSFITAGAIFYALVAGSLALFLGKKQHKDQFTFMVVLFSFLRLFVDTAPLSVIILSATPAIVNIATDEVKKYIKIQ